MPADRGDVVLGRRDIAASYHLSVVLDDADSQVELVVRGADLESSTPLHRLLQELLGLPTPVYLHHPLVCDKTANACPNAIMTLVLPPSGRQVSVLQM